jgi:mono/diheme cytochrome c family protein
MIRIMTKIITVLITLMNAAGSHADEHNHPELITGKQLFEFHCSTCHQMDGNGNVLAGYPAINHTTLRTWQIRHKIQGEKVEGRQMPSFQNMSKSEAKLIADYIKSLN